jgi:hypothetical protein
MIDAFAAEVEATHRRGEYQRAAAPARAADVAHPTRGAQPRSWLFAGGGVGSPAVARSGRAPRRRLLGWGWMTALLGRPA